ncbi:MAG: TatD family hydrolase [Bacteroidota bacterium]
MILTDTHTHLYSKEFDDDRTMLVEKAIQAGVSRLFIPNVDSESIPGMFQVVKQFPENCFPMIGLHPCSVNAHYQQELQVMDYWLIKRSFVAIGEIGIDLYWDKTYFTHQLDAFRMQIQLAQKHHLPYIIHCRNAFDEVMQVVRQHHTICSRAIFHCFSGSPAQAQEVVEAGNFKLGIGGVVTFKNSGLDKVVEAIDLKHLVLETDAPYLAPMPHRGKRNEPNYLLLIAQKVAEIKNISVEEVAAVTTKNSIDVFGI